ncbi:hypothetical protein OSB04_016539, partial [Centaurea solstitialis]
MEIEDKPNCHHLHHNSLMTHDLKFLILHSSYRIPKYSQWAYSLVLKVITLAYAIQSTQSVGKTERPPPEEENRCKQPKQSISSSPNLNQSIMEDLPTELTIDILSRLPVKTIIHCKRVCKKWRNLVSDSSFVNLHLSRSPTGIIIHHKKPYLIRSATGIRIIVHHKKPRIDNWNIHNDPGILMWVEIEDIVDHHRLHYHGLFNVDLNRDVLAILPKSRVVGSVNGLICVWHYFPLLNIDDTYICNPITREYVVLPRERFLIGDDVGVVLYGFGVSSLTGEYKVVRAFQAKKVVQNQPNVLEAEVYTLGTGQWRSLGPVPVSCRLNTFKEFYGLFLNNHCHWIVSHNEICTFDLEKETFQLLPSPPPPPVKDIWSHRQSLAILNGCLCKLDTYRSELKIWVMKEYGIKNSWHREVVIRREICVTRWPLYEPIHLIAGLKDGSLLMVFENKLCVYDPRSQTIEDTKMFDPELSGWAYRPSFLKLQNSESERVHLLT